MSQYAVRVFERQHSKDTRFGVLKGKICQIYPSIHDVQAELNLPIKHTLHLLFVGIDFMRKGLPAVTRTHAGLLALGIPVHTTVVSSLKWLGAEYISPCDDYDLESERSLLNQPGIEHIPDASHNEVLTLMSRAHFTLLPTLHDTFGYSVIESLACGTPVIATATCAMPELIEEGINGFLIPLCVDGHFLEWQGMQYRQEPNYYDYYRTTIDELSTRLVERLSQFWETRADYSRLRDGAANVFETRFSPLHARRKLEELYEESMYSA